MEIGKTRWKWMRSAQFLIRLISCLAAPSDLPVPGQRHQLMQVSGHKHTRCVWGAGCAPLCLVCVCSLFLTGSTQAPNTEHPKVFKITPYKPWKATWSFGQTIKLDSGRLAYSLSWFSWLPAGLLPCRDYDTLLQLIYKWAAVSVNNQLLRRRLVTFNVYAVSSITMTVYCFRLLNECKSLRQ